MYAILRRFAGVSITNTTSSNLRRSYASFTLRDVVHDFSDETGTLVNQFAKHIAVERYSCADHVLPPTKIRYSDYFPITDERYFRRSVQKTDVDQLPALIIYAFSYRPNAAAPMYVETLNTLDAQATAQLRSMDTVTVLETLYSFLFLIPNWLKRTDFYAAAMDRLVQESNCSKQRFLQICFYLGLRKRGDRNDLEALLGAQLADHLPALSPMDLALVSNAAYKTSTVVAGPVREAYEAALVDATLNVKLSSDSSADALLISYIKALRLQRVHDERISKFLQEICLNPDQLALLEPRGLAHIFAYFAEMQWDQPECMRSIVDRLMALKTSDLRAKDLNTFIWCCAQLNCDLNPNQLKKLELIALRKLVHGDYDRFCDQLVDTCLSLCTLGHYSKQLYDAAEELKSKQFQRPRAQPKVDSRLTVLRSAVAIEQPSWTDIKATQVFKELTRAPGYLLKQRQDLTAYAEQLMAEEDVEGVDLVCPIAGINLPSLRVQTNSDKSSVYFVELLTLQQTLKFSESATSLVRLKRRLLEAMGQRVVLLRSGEMTTNAEALQRLLEESSTGSSENAVQAQGLQN